MVSAQFQRVMKAANDCASHGTEAVREALLQLTTQTPKWDFDVSEDEDTLVIEYRFFEKHLLDKDLVTVRFTFTSEQGYADIKHHLDEVSERAKDVVADAVGRWAEVISSKAGIPVELR